MTQIPILKGDDEKMREKHKTIKHIIIQLLVISIIVGALAPFACAPFVHDLLVYDWKLPFTSEPSETAIVNTTVLNNGGHTESNILVKLFVNETEIDSETIAILHKDELVTVSLSWTPETEGKYNVTTYVVPVNGENNVENNAESAYSWTRTGKTVTVDTQGDFSTITEAIEITNLEIYYGNATIWVASGTYYESDLLIQNSLTFLVLIGENRDTTVVSGQYSGADDQGFLVYADNVKITRFKVAMYDTGVELWGLNSNITGNLFYDNDVDMRVQEESTCNIISDNIVWDPGWSMYGINLNWSRVVDGGNVISNNTIFEKGCGIFLDHASNTIISNNNITNIMSHKIPAPARGDGITLVSSSNNSIIDNTISNCAHEAVQLLECSDNNVIGNILTGSDNEPTCDWGIDLRGTKSTTIVENTVREFDCGMYFSDSNNTVVHHNNLVNNTDYQVSIDVSFNFTWNSLNLVGNYWSDYNGTDNYSGPYQNETGSDGIGDTPYVIDENNQDDYPLMWKWFPGDLDGDGDVDRYDFSTFSAAYGSQMGDPNYNPLADLDYDGDVDWFDYGIFAENYGKSIPY